MITVVLPMEAVIQYICLFLCFTEMCDGVWSLAMEQKNIWLLCVTFASFHYFISKYFEAAITLDFYVLM